MAIVVVAMYVAVRMRRRGGRGGITIGGTKNAPLLPLTLLLLLPPLPPEVDPAGAVAMAIVLVRTVVVAVCTHLSAIL